MSEIFIHGLRVATRIGVPDEERMEAQEIEVDVCLRTAVPFDGMEDDIARTVDYAAVCRRVAELAMERPRRLIETLAQEIACVVVEEFGAVSAGVEIRKFILPETKFVGVRCEHLQGLIKG
ncbi:MAG: dihydroneopterin aldolase [Terrimicrobiaceae bacterium]|jgi:dihydroneopterin aldolase